MVIKLDILKRSNFSQSNSQNRHGSQVRHFEKP